MAMKSAKKSVSKKSDPKGTRKASKRQSGRGKQTAKRQSGPGDELRIAITFPSPGDKAGPVAYGSRMSSGVIDDFIPEERSVGRALEALERLGFRITSRGQLTASARTNRRNYEKVFGTKLSEFRLQDDLALNCQARSFFYPGPDSKWSPDPDLKSLIDEAYIQWPHIYLNQRFPPQPPSPLPPRVDYHHLRVPGDVNVLLNVSDVHREGTTGRGVTGGSTHIGH